MKNKSKKQCVRCEEYKDNLTTLENYQAVVSESAFLLKLYEEENMFSMEEEDMICWDCICNEIIGTLCDGIYVEDEIAIRKEYKKTWGPDYGGNLYSLMNEALEFSCFNCGDGYFITLNYDFLSVNSQKWAREIMKKYSITLKDSGRKFNICLGCITDELKAELGAALAEFTKAA